MIYFLLHMNLFDRLRSANYELEFGKLPVLGLFFKVFLRESYTKSRK